MGMYIAIGDAASLCGVSVKTLRRWHSKGWLLPAFRTKGGHRRYRRSDIIRYIDDTYNARSRAIPKERGAIYVRVSSSKQKDDLTRQIENAEQFCIDRNIEIIETYSDIGSGMNDKRRGLHKLMDDVSVGRFDTVVVSYNDRLARFGIRILRKFFESWHVNLQVINETIIDKKDENARLVTDLTAVLYSFMGRLYRKRRGKGKKKKNRKNTIKPLNPNAVSC